MSAPPPSVSIVVVNYNGLTDTLACLQSLQAATYPNFQVIVVDNGSRGNDAAAIAAAFPDVTLIPLARNVGFVAGNNAGLRHAMEQGADYLLWLNNDTEVAPDFLEPLVALLESQPEFGIATPLIYYHSVPTRLWAAGGWVHFDDFYPTGHMTMLSEVETDPNGVAEIPYASGCAMLVRGDVVARIGYGEEAYFMYCEDPDYCLRARAAGWKSALLTNTRIYHKVVPDAPLSLFTTYYLWRNALFFVQNNTDANQYAAFRRLYRRRSIGVWRSFLNEAIQDPALRVDKKHQESVIQKALAMHSAFAGRKGVRESYQSREKLPRLGCDLLMRVMVIFAIVLHPFARRGNAAHPSPTDG